MKKLFLFLAIIVFQSFLFAQTPIYEWIGKDSQSLKDSFGSPESIQNAEGKEVYIYHNELGYQSFQFGNDRIVKLNTTTFWKTKSKAKSALNYSVKLYKNDGFTITDKNQSTSIIATNGKVKVSLELTYKEGWYWVSETVTPDEMIKPASIKESEKQPEKLISIEKTENTILIPKNPNIMKDGKREGTWTVLYDVGWNETEYPEFASYYRIINYKNGKPDGLVTDYYMNGAKQGESYLKSDNPDVFADGTIKFFYPNGRISREASGLNGKMHGAQKLYDMFGRSMETIYKDGNIVGSPKVINKDGMAIRNSYFSNDWFQTDTSVSGFVRDIKISKKGTIYITNQSVYEDRQRSTKDGLPQDLYVSYDMGLNWKRKNKPNEWGMEKLILLEDGTLFTPTYQYAGYGFRGLNRTTDDGETWEGIEIDKNGKGAINFVDAIGNEIFVTMEDYLYTSKDRGNTWKKTLIHIEKSNDIYASNINVIDHIAARDKFQLYGVTRDGRIISSTDQGQNWTCIKDLGDVGLQIAVDGLGVLWAVCTDGHPYRIYYTSNSGKTWQERETNFDQCRKLTPGFRKMLGNPYSGFFICSGCGLSDGKKYLYSGITAFDYIEKIGLYDESRPNDNMDYAGIQCVAYHPEGYLFVGTRGRGVFYNNPFKNNFPAF